MQHRKSFVRSLLLILLALIVGLGAGFLIGQSFQQPQNDLRLTVTVDEEAGFRDISSEELGNNYSNITYLNVSEVTVDVDGKKMLLENAIRDGHVTVEEIIAQAKEDVRNKKCFLKYDTTLGLSEFIYSYPEAYDLKVRYDVFECSDGKQHLLNDFYITAPGKAKDMSYGFMYTDQNGDLVRLKYEDWGLEFTAEEASPTGITINYSQWGGMAAGDLSVKWIHIYDSSDTMVDAPLEWDKEPIPITANTFQGHMSIDWEDWCGPLPAGDYTLVLYIEDDYSEGEIHPLIRKYCIGQYFPVSFTVP